MNSMTKPTGCWVKLSMIMVFLIRGPVEIYRLLNGYYIQLSTMIKDVKVIPELAYWGRQQYDGQLLQEPFKKT